MELTAEEIKKQALALGADMVGIASIDRFKGAPIQMDPLQIMPEAKSVIAMAFRVFRGSMRGIEQGTYFSNYSAMGYGGITYLYMPIVVINLCKIIEDSGYEAVPMGHQSDWRGIDNEGYIRDNYSRPVEPGKAAPDVMIHLRIASYLAGLGEIGYSKMLLTPKFGPFNRVGIIITEAELEPDPIYDGPQLCNRCMACVKECPSGAISGTETVKLELAGRTLEWGELDCKACGIGLVGGKLPENSDEKADYHEMYGKKLTRGQTPFVKKPKNVYNTGQAVDGARGCSRACLASLEARDVLTNKFKKKFRRHKRWEMDWSTEAPKLDYDLIGPDKEADVNEAD